MLVDGFLGAPTNFIVGVKRRNLAVYVIGGLGLGLSLGGGLLPLLLADAFLPLPVAGFDSTVQHSPNVGLLFLGKNTRIGAHLFMRDGFIVLRPYFGLLWDGFRHGLILS